MRTLFLLAALAGCGPHTTTTSCPKVEEIRADDPRIAQLTVERCTADAWAPAITKCLREAKDEAAQELCFEALTPAQATSLKAAFAPVIAAQKATERAAIDRNLGEELDAYHLEELTARAPACGDYLAAITAERKKLLECPTGDTLRAFSFHEMLVQQVRELTKVTDDTQLAARCATHAATMAGLARTECI